MFTAIRIACVALAGYLIGNFNSALVISKLKKSDVRKMGSGNPGTMNMFRSFGKLLGVLTLVMDILKGVIPCLIGWFVCGQAWSFGANKIGVYIGGLSVIVGHIFPVFLKFKGGKGIASSIGVCLVIHPIATLISFAVGVVFLIVTKIGSVTSFIIISVPLAMEAYSVSSTGGNVAALVLLFSLFFLTLFAHRKNVVHLFQGTDKQVVLFKKKKKSA